MKTWQSFDLTSSKVTKVYSVRRELDKIVVVTQDKLWNITEDNTLELLGNVSALFGGLYEIGQTKTYLGTDKKLLASPIGTYNQSAKVADIYSIIAVDKDNVVTLDDNVVGKFYNPAGTSFSFTFPQFQGWNNNFYNGMVLQGLKLFWVNTWGAKNYYDRTKKKPPQEAVWVLDLNSKQATDITENLGCNNMLGEPFGPVVSLTCNNAKTKLYISTEEGIWERRLDTPGWTKIYPGWGNHQLFVLPDDSLLAIETKDDRKVLSLYKNGDWLQLPNLTLNKDNIILSATSRSNNIYLSFFERKFIAIINIFGIKPETYNKPSLATYLNIDTPLAAISASGKVILATPTTLYSIDKKGGQQKIASLTQPIREITRWRDGLLLAGDNSLDYALGNTIRTIAQSPGGVGSKVAASDRLIAYLHAKTITLYNQYFDKILTQEIDGDFINDIAIKDNQIFIVGYNNRKNNGVAVKVAFMHIWELNTTELKYIDKVWYFNSADLSNDMADTMLNGIELINNKYALCYGKSAGGNTIFRWNGRDLKTPTLVKTDIFNDPFNSKDAHMLYYALVDLESLKVVRGQFSIPRADKMISNTNTGETIYSNGSDLFIGAKSAYQIFGRDTNKFANAAIAPYNDGDATLLKIDLNTFERKFWITPGHGDVLLFNDNFTLISTNATNLPITPNGKPANSGIANNTYLAVQ